MKAHTIFNVFMYAIVIAYILYINFATYYNSGTKFLNFLIKLFNNWVFRLIFLLIVGFFALDLFPYGGFIFAILLTIAFLNTNMLVYKKEISETFIGGSDAAPFEPTYEENDGGNIIESMTYKAKINKLEARINQLKMAGKYEEMKALINELDKYY
jgi:hypothetical protein